MTAAVLVAAGCSADVTRFSLGGFGTTGTILPFASADAPPPGYGTAPPRGYAKAPPPSAFEETELPPAAPPPKNDYRVVGRDYGDAKRTGRPPPSGPPRVIAKAPPPRTLVAEPPPAKAPPGDTADTVEVQPGDTLYSIARRHGVPASAVKEANALPGTTIRPGQRLVLPAGAADRRGKTTPPPGGGTGVAVGVAPPAGEAPPAGGSHYTVKRGDTLSRIALAHKVSVAQIMSLNGITDPTKVWIGRELVLPGNSVAVADPPPAPPPEAAPRPPRIVHVKPRIITGGTGEHAAAPGKTETAEKTETEKLLPPVVASGKFRWPVRGRVIVGFGPQVDGSKNEGVNLAAPLGTEVHAAESGRVHYVGDGLKSYGNLILIRHANDWATAYGHVDRILVKPNEEVKRGQVIARVGKSGPVDQPQLKFELRKASLPVNPLPHLAK